MVKTKFPDGNGGWTEIEGDKIAGSKANANKQAQILQDEFIQGSATFMDKIWKVCRLVATEMGLDEKQMVFAIALLSINMRENFPQGGPVAFDQIALDASTYWDANNVDPKTTR